MYSTQHTYTNVFYSSPQIHKAKLFTCSHTNDNETILGPSDPHIDLMRISEEAKVVPEPSAVWLNQIMIPDLLHRLRPDCGQDHISIFISYESTGKENSNDD